MEMETVQIKGIDSTNRVTKGKLDKDAKIVITERIMTHGNQTATTRFEVDMDGDGQVPMLFPVLWQGIIQNRFFIL